ncbi:hypothetical protein BJV77DRAFT_1033739 [Russula vinacea]|nr:hypothetical protein BJV77DRAFT_1033739 [Russula vinacea]
MLAARLMMPAVALTLVLTIMAAVAPRAGSALTSISRSSIVVCYIFTSCILISLGFWLLIIWTCTTCSPTFTPTYTRGQARADG